MKSIYERTKTVKILVSFSVCIFVLCAICSIVLIAKQQYVFLILLFFPILLGLLFAFAAWIERKGTLELNDDGILFNYRVFSEYKELNKWKVFLRYEDIHHVDEIFCPGNGFTRDTILYRFILNDKREVEAYFYHFGAEAEEDIVFKIKFKLDKTAKNEIPIDRPPDVEVLFKFNGSRKTAVADGYRPQHLVIDDYLTTGIHRYYGVSEVEPNGTAKGTITFISPESYPKCLWIGKIIPIHEGERIVGHATVTKVLNDNLHKDF